MFHLTRWLPALIATGGLLLTSGAQAATRTYIVTDYDSIRVEAPIAVAVQTKRGVTARGEGDADLLERIDLSVSAHVLTIRLKPSPFEGRRTQNSSARLFLTVPSLRRAQLSGSGSLAVEGMSAQSATIVAAGSGLLSVGGLATDALTLFQQGAGLVRLSGKAAKAVMQNSGSGSTDAGALLASDLDLTAEGAGSVKVRATRSAKVVAIGAASVIVDGRPACTVRHAGSGNVTCGGEDF